MAKAENNTVKVKLVKSKFGRTPGHKECVEGLGLRKINDTSELEDSPSVRGMINKVSYLLSVEG